jgi:hypothetical protein
MHVMASIVRPVVVCCLLTTSLVAQKADVLPEALQQMANTERAFAARIAHPGFRLAFTLG